MAPPQENATMIDDISRRRRALLPASATPLRFRVIGGKRYSANIRTERDAFRTRMRSSSSLAVKSISEWNAIVLLAEDQRLRVALSGRVPSSVAKATIKPRDFSEDLQKLRELQENPDPELGEAPTSDVIRSVEACLPRLAKIGAMPSGIRPSADGGAGICFAEGDAYAHIEFLNDGTVHCLAYSSDSDPEAWSMANFEDEDLKYAWSLIRAHL